MSELDDIKARAAEYDAQPGVVVDGYVGILDDLHRAIAIAADALGDLRIVQADRAVVRSELVQARNDVLRGRASLKNKPLFDDDKQWLSDTESYEEYR